MVLDVSVLNNGWTVAGVIASFLVAFVALGLGLSSLIQTERLQKKEREERLLNEIIEWATGIYEIPAQMNYVVWREILDMNEPRRSVYIENMTRQNIMELRRRYTILTGRIVRVKMLSTSFKKYKLDTIANRVIVNLNNAISTLDKRSKGRISDDEVEKARIELEKCADALIKKATGIYTKNI